MKILKKLASVIVIPAKIVGYFISSVFSFCSCKAQKDGSSQEQPTQQDKPQEEQPK